MSGALLIRHDLNGRHLQINIEGVAKLTDQLNYEADGYEGLTCRDVYRHLHRGETESTRGF